MKSKLVQRIETLKAMKDISVSDLVDNLCRAGAGIIGIRKYDNDHAKAARHAYGVALHELAKKITYGFFNCDHDAYINVCRLIHKRGFVDGKRSFIDGKRIDLDIRNQWISALRDRLKVALRDRLKVCSPIFLNDVVNPMIGLGRDNDLVLVYQNHDLVYSANTPYEYRNGILEIWNRMSENGDFDIVKSRMDTSYDKVVRDIEAGKYADEIKLFYKQLFWLSHYSKMKERENIISCFHELTQMMERMCANLCKQMAYYLMLCEVFLLDNITEPDARSLLLTFVQDMYGSDEIPDTDNMMFGALAKRFRLVVSERVEMDLMTAEMGKEGKRLMSALANHWMEFYDIVEMTAMTAEKGRRTCFDDVEAMVFAEKAISMIKGLYPDRLRVVQVLGKLP